MSILKAQNLNFGFTDTQLITDVSFEVPTGSLFSIIGPNGAGKSTLLSLLCGDNKGTGHIEIDGCLLENWNGKKLAKKRAVLPQNVSLNFSFTVSEVVLMGRSPYVNGLAESALDRSIAKQALKTVDLEHYWDRDYTSLSGGEKQRVQFARVLVQLCESALHESLEGKLLFLDEAVANLDPAHQHQVFKLLKTFQKQGLTIINVLHDIQLTAQYSDHVLIMKDAKMVICDKMKSVLTPEMLEQAYDMPFRKIDDQQTSWPFLIADL
ncbi:heme ABC transporter ATP-binding protein [Thiomicrorhabdus hydrogeniphila]